MTTSEILEEAKEKIQEAMDAWIKCMWTKEEPKNDAKISFVHYI